MSVVQERIAALVASSCGVEPGTLRPDQALMDYGLDSVRTMELLGELEAAFSITIVDEDLPRLRTLRSAARFVETRLAETGRG
jgi:acyl carrier protein